MIIPADAALDFVRFCRRNPKPCPLVGVSDTGDPMMHTFGRDIDIRSDVPTYTSTGTGGWTARRTISAISGRMTWWPLRLDVRLPSSMH